MSYKRTWFEKLIDNLPNNNPFYNFTAKYILVPFWSWRTPATRKDGGARSTTQPSDNLQNMMNLVMPLKDKSPLGRAKAVAVISQNSDAIYAGLDNVGTIHAARFDIVDDKLCMLSVYDGDFSNYIRDFIFTIGDVFDGLMDLVEDGDLVKPCRHNVEAFIEWVHERDLYQVPDVPTDIMTFYKKDDAGQDDLRTLPKKLILQLKVNKNISIGRGYRGYPGFSAAQVKHKLGVGW
jgi:hypothetical protein